MKFFGIVSSCLNNKCAYNYSDAMTPRLISIAPSSGSQGDQITVQCAECGSADTVTMVTVGGVECTSLTFAATSLSCTLGKLSIIIF